MGNNNSYHIFQLKTEEGSWEKGLYHIFPNSDECCDDRGDAISTFESIRARKALLLLVEFKKDKKTREVSYTILTRNFLFKDDEEKESKLNGSLKMICQKRRNQLFA
jgi:hypothetical protein